tara:strand:+ start:49375 stop:50232 length:858 start_codon:yes stop_codon:yes gene_type:complete
LRNNNQLLGFKKRVINKKIVMRTITQKLATLFLAIGLIFISCSDANDQEGEAPTIPSSESMSITFDGLSTQNKVNSTVQQSDTTIGIAYLSALAAGAILEVNFAVPKVLLSAAEGQEAEYLGDGEWQWTYSASGNQGSFSVRLTAQTGREQVEWNFYVSTTSSQVNWDDILLFSGTSTYDGNDGTWNIYRPDTEQLISASSWSIDETTTMITLSVYEGTNETTISRIDYMYSGTVKEISFSNLVEDTQTVIHWDVNTGVGSITSTNYNNGQQACWDENYQDVACS